jgi:hypothetical protein
MGRDIPGLFAQTVLHVFQSTRPYGARLKFFRRQRQQPPRFNPRARMGRDLPPHFMQLELKLFQSTRPYGARHVLILR